MLAARRYRGHTMPAAHVSEQRRHTVRLAPVVGVVDQKVPARFFPLLRECSMTASGPGNTRLVWPSSKRTRYGGSPPAPRTSTISPARSDWPTTWPRTRNRSPAAACIRPPPHPRCRAARATEDRPTVCPLPRQVSISMPVPRPSFRAGTARPRPKGSARGPVRVAVRPGDCGQSFPASASRRQSRGRPGRRCIRRRFGGADGLGRRRGHCEQEHHE